MPQVRDPFLPALRAMRQLGDPVLQGVVVGSIALTLALFAALGWAAQRVGHDWLGLAGWLSGLLGGVGAALGAWLLFLPVASVVATLFVDQIANRVERRYYSWLAPARAASIAAQLWDGVVLGGQVLVLQVIALVLALPLFGMSLPLGWAVAAWAIGRGLFVAVAMRRMPRRAALELYRARRADVLLQGALMTAASLVPLLNLLVPVAGVAAMVHVLHEGDAPAPGLSAAPAV